MKFDQWLQSLSDELGIDNVAEYPWEFRRYFDNGVDPYGMSRIMQIRH